MRNIISRIYKLGAVNVCNFLNFSLQNVLCLNPNKVHPRTGQNGPKGDQRCSPTLSLTLALNGGGWSMPRLIHFALGKYLVPIVQEAGWVQHISPPLGFYPRNVQPVASLTILTELSQPTLIPTSLLLFSFAVSLPYVGLLLTPEIIPDCNSD